MTRDMGLVQAKSSVGGGRRTARPVPGPGRLANLLVAASGLRAASAFGFGDRRFKYEGLLDTGSLGLQATAGPIVALGDSNGDQLCAPFRAVRTGALADS